MRSFALIWIAGIVHLAGCGASVKTGGVQRIDSCAGMIEYLQQVPLPALESVVVWQNEYGPGLKLTTAHYEIFTTLLEPLMLSQVPGFLESAYRGYNSQLPEPIPGSSIEINKFAVYLFAERQQWEDFTRGFAARQASLFLKIKAGAYYLNGACVAYNIGRERTFSALGHEGWHQFNSRHFSFRLPSWLDEGIAILFEVNRSDKGLFYFEPGRNTHRLGALKETLKKRKMMPLRELITINPGEVLATNRTEAVAAFYSQSYALVRFLREADYGKRLRNYHQLLLDGLRGDWPLSKVHKEIAVDRNIPLTIEWNRTVGPLLFRYYIDDDSDLIEIEKEYVDFCRRIVYRVHLR